MKKITYCFYLICLFFFSASAQKINLITLDNYTFTPGESFVGKISPSNSEDSLMKIKLKGSNRSKFAIRNKNELHLMKPSDLTKDFFYEISIQAKTKSGVVQNHFKIVKDDFIKNGVVAHRGAWKNQGVSENSIGSLNRAIEIGCEGSEFDIWLTKDGVPIVSHDPTIGGKEIKETTAAEMAKVPLENNEFVPTLEEYIKTAIKQNKTRLFLEIKPFGVGEETTRELTQKAIAMIQEYKAQAWVEYISFGYDAVKEVKRLDATAKNAYLSGDKLVDELKRDGIDGLDYNIGIFIKNRSIVEQAKKLGITTNFWTVNHPKDMLALIEAGVDYITTDEPQILIELLKK